MVVLVDRTHSLCCLPSSTRYTAGGPAPFSWRSSRRTVLDCKQSFETLSHYFLSIWVFTHILFYLYLSAVSLTNNILIVFSFWLDADCF